MQGGVDNRVRHVRTIPELNLAIENNNIAEEVTIPPGYKITNSNLQSVIQAVISSEHLCGAFTMKQVKLELEDVNIAESFSKILHLQYRYKKSGEDVVMDYDLFTDCQAKDVLSNLPNIGKKLSLMCDIRFVKFADKTVQMKIDNVTLLKAELEGVADSDFDACVAKAIKKFSSLKTLELHCTKYVKNVMDAVVDSCSINELIIMYYGSVLSSNDKDSIYNAVSRAINIAYTRVFSSCFSVHDSIDKVPFAIPAARAWARHKDSDYFTAQELAFFYHHKSIIQYTAICNKLWTQEEIDNFEQDIADRLPNRSYLYALSGAGYGNLSKDMIYEISHHVQQEDINRKCKVFSQTKVANPILTKRSISNMLMVESALMLFVLKGGGNISYTPVILNLAVVAADWYRSRRKVSLADYADNKFDKCYDVGMASLSAISFSMWSVGASMLLATYAIPDFSTRVEGGAVFCGIVYSALHASNRSVMKCKIGSNGRGFEESIYLSVSTCAMTNFVMLAATDASKMQMKIGIQACVLATLYAYDKYQDKVYHDAIWAKQKGEQSEVAI
ncbi:MAG: hypothetical protein ACK5WS_00620 [Alphaproteobacteria bacterium]|jgi:hypothetical protein|nr:hypothetical protein [Candidatus Jidaibacter sp.]